MNRIERTQLLLVQMCCAYLVMAGASNTGTGVVALGVFALAAVLLAWRPGLVIRLPA